MQNVVMVNVASYRFIPNVIMLRVVRLNVVMLSAMALMLSVAATTISCVSLF